MNSTAQLKDYYQILGVTPDADAAAIRGAYRRLARQLHPDRNKDASAEERFKEVGEAYDILKDERKRAAYDQMRAGNPFGFNGGAGFGRAGNADIGDLSDLFENLVGGIAGGGPRRGARRRAGGDIKSEIQIDLETAYRGGSRRIDVGGRSLQVRIPAGVLDGQKIRLKGQGGAGVGGAPAGDLILTVRIGPHEQFRIEGRDLVTRVALAPWEAALGASVPVPTLSGALELKVPAGARSGQKMRARGRGMPGSPAGDLIVELMIQTPPADTAAVRQLYRQLQESTDFDPRDAGISPR